MLIKVIGVIIFLILIAIWWGAIDISTDYYSQCYTAEEYSGHAVFGNCSGKKGEENCKKCRYYCDVESIGSDAE